MWFTLVRNPWFSLVRNRWFSLSVFCNGDLNNDGTIDALQLFLAQTQDGEEWDFLFYSNDSEDSLNLSATPVFNPFQLDLYTAMRFLTFTNLVDFDSDEDLDLIISEFTGDVVSPPEFDMLYMQNIGTPDTPEFSIPQDIFLDPSGVPLVLLPTFGDLDKDGDMDMLGINVVDEEVYIYTYFENTSTTDIPEFDNALNSPFGLDTFFTEGIVTPTLYDYDHDGDLDLFVTSDGDVYPKTNLYLNESVSKIELADFQKAGLKVYPNPATERVQITFQDPAYGHLMIYDQKGRIVLHQLLRGSPQHTVDISHLPSGAYVLYYEDQVKKASEPLIIK